MPVTIPDKARRKLPLRTRLGWFVLLYAGGVGTVALVGYGLRLWLKP